MKNTRLLAVSCDVHYTDGMRPADRRDANHAAILDCLNRARAYTPDFVCFPEIMPQSDIGTWPDMLALAEPLDSPHCRAVTAAARALGSHVIHTLLETDGTAVFNTAVVLGRDGSLLGCYRKFHATGYEIQAGVTPGSKVPGWNTDCGRIGCAICFDLKFPEVGIELSRRAAQCVFYPTMFAGGRRLASWATDYGFHMIRCHRTGGCIVDPTGQTIAVEGPPEPLTNVKGTVKWTAATVNLDHRTYHLDRHGEKLQAIAAKFGGGVTIRLMTDEAIVNIASNMDDLSIDDMEAEFALKPLRTYLDEAARIRTDALER